MQQMQVAWFNLMELSTVTVTSEASDGPSYRLYDRLFGKCWKAAETGAQTIKSDQAALGYETNTLVIPAGHTLAGTTIQWQSSSNDSSYADLVASWVPADSGLILKTAACSTRYQRIVISGATRVPQIGEILLTSLVTFTAPDFGSRISKQPVVSRVAARGGPPHFLKWAPSLRSLTYEIPSGRIADRASFEQWFDIWDGCKPFFLIDHKGDSYFAELLEPPDFMEKDVNSFALSLKIQQVY